MRKERKPSVKDAVRTTIFMTGIQDFNLDCLAIESGKLKGELIREGISIALEKYGYPNDRKVAFTIKKGGI